MPNKLGTNILLRFDITGLMLEQDDYPACPVKPVKFLKISCQNCIDFF